MSEMFSALQFRRTFTRIVSVKIEAYNTFVLRVFYVGVKHVPWP